jgi:hypothetical protein
MTDHKATPIIHEIIGHLGAAAMQRSPSDDKIIAEHIDAALVLASKALASLSTAQQPETKP